jgi:hypothetical protein
MLTTHNGCLWSRSEGCTTILDGLFTKGLHAAVQTFCDLALQAANKRMRELDEGQGNSSAFVRDPQWESLEQIQPHLRAALETASDLRLAWLNEQNAAHESTAKTATVSCCQPVDSLA